MKNLTVALALVSILISCRLFAADSSAQSGVAKKELTTAEKIEIKKATEHINRENGGPGGDMVFHCKFNVPVSFEPEIAKAFLSHNGDGPYYCSSVRLGLVSLCRDGDKETQDTYKKMMKEKIKKIHCFVSDKPEAIDVSFKDGTMIVGLGPKMNDNKIKGTVSDFIKAHF